MIICHIFGYSCVLFVQSNLLILIPVPPSEPSKPKVTMITKSTMTVIWERPALDGGSDIDGYYLEKREKKSLQWFKVYTHTLV